MKLFTNKTLYGCVPIISTPFRVDETVDEESLRSLILFAADAFTNTTERKTLMLSAADTPRSALLAIIPETISNTVLYSNQNKWAETWKLFSKLDFVLPRTSGKNWRKRIRSCMFKFICL